jgi:hypothetical protein
MYHKELKGTDQYRSLRNYLPMYHLNNLDCIFLKLKLRKEKEFKGILLHIISLKNRYILKLTMDTVLLHNTFS